MLQWTRCPREILHWPDASVEVELLPEQYVDAPNPSAHGCRERTFDADLVFSNRLDRLLRSPFLFQLKCLLPRIDLQPVHFSICTVTFLYCSIENSYGCLPDV